MLQHGWIGTSSCLLKRRSGGGGLRSRVQSDCDTNTNDTQYFKEQYNKTIYLRDWLPSAAVRLSAKRPLAANVALKAFNNRLRYRWEQATHDGQS